MDCGTVVGSIWSASRLLATLSCRAWAKAVAGEAVLRLLGGEDDVLQQALDYTSILFPGCIVMWLFNMMLCVERGTGNVQLPAMLMILGAIIQVPRMANAR